jgi:hypothetical protein
MRPGTGRNRPLGNPNLATCQNTTGAALIPSSLDYPQWKTKWNLPCSGPLCGCIKLKGGTPT